MNPNQLHNTLSELFVCSFAIYLALGLLFAIAFIILGVQKIDPHARNAPWGFRLLLLPGATFLWPILLRRWLFKLPPPTERNSHRP